MIEIVYEKEKQKPEGNEGFFRIPNNIRQIGEVNETQKIYIEDYAYTYLCRISSGNSSKGKAAILLGQANWKDGISYLFVKSAVVLPDMEITEEHLSFTREIWNHVYEKNKEYFPDQEIVGWYLSIPGCSMELHEVICRTHLDHFGGNDKVLMVMEPIEKEEAFYRYEDGELSRQPGFYIYYEKNEPMQNFLVAQNDKAETKSEQVSDQAVKTFRKKVETKSEGKKQTKNTSVFRTASVCMMVAVLAVGVLYLNDYHKLKKTETVISKLDDKNSGKELVETKPVNGLVSENRKKDSQDAADGEAAGTDTEETDAGTDGAATSGSSDGTSDGQKDTDGKKDDAKEPDADDGASEKKTDSGSDASGTDAEDDSKNSPAGAKDSDDGESGQTAGSTHQSYTIHEGDTITSISMRYYGNSSKIKEICALNGLSPEDFIFPGQKILLP
ncbi:LysM peptidoglycan-binding domain-containing protein [Blautia sp. NSJ-175]|uniref:LysM peptidoglycan-binding domain-containing protein n=1 Tax=Blautia sp. NSJ-175 TaxID=2931396 RepID=UPI001FD49812|nr:LysM peptidoglycan-binding domain-containing protein [Blautia sp. NSJ-175]MCJ7847987.1 LysM peptidoglycan-binding domain-containing protein [Blautia sp. NSJ-175]